MNGEGKKYHARRLFSVDPIISSRTASSDSSGQVVHERRPIGLSQVDELVQGDPFGGGVGAETRLNDTAQRPDHGKLSSTTSIAQLLDQPLRSLTPDSVASTSVSRTGWDKVRQHVLLSSSSSTPPSEPSTVAAPWAPPRSTTLKPSRFARLGFRHVVEQTKEAAENTLTFANEIRVACWMSRYGEQFKPKGERDNLAATMGSTLYLPFMPNPASFGPSIMPGVVPKKHDTGGPQTIPSPPPFSPNQWSVPTLKPLWQLLMRYATPTPNGMPRCPTLPHETLVLSVLQSPFLRPGEQGWMLEERRFAMESFELIFKAWFPDNESSFVNYCQWCCIVATMSPGHLRLRALNCIQGLLGSGDTALIRTPAAFESLFAGLLSLVALSSTNPIYFSDSDGMKIIQSCIKVLRSGICVALDPKALMERYGLTYSKGDESTIYDLMAFGSLAKCIESSKGPSRAWLIRFACNDGYVPLHQEWFPTPWSTMLHIEKLSSMSRAIIAILLSSGETGLGPPGSDIQLLLQLLQTKILPEIDIIDREKTTGIKQYIAKIAHHILIFDWVSGQDQWAIPAIHGWYKGSSDWKDAFQSVLRDLVSGDPWPTILRALNVMLRSLQDPARQGVFAFVLPLLNQRIVEDPPPFPCPDLSSILGQLSKQYPPIFYKPLFACATSSKDYAVVNHLCTLTAISKFVSDCWIRDAEMISVALIGNVRRETNASHAGGIYSFKPAQLGQLIILVELIGQIQVARKRKEEIPQTDRAFLEIMKFAVYLESRLSVLLDAREREFLYPFSHRVLFCILFRELRLLTRLSKPAPWLPMVVTWFIDYHEDGMREADYEESKDTLARLQALYEAAQNGIQSSGNWRKSSTALPMSPLRPTQGEDRQKYGISDALAQRLQILTSAQKGFAAKGLKLLVLTSPLMSTEDYARLAPVIWMHNLTESVPSALNSACYLAMQCAEKAPQDFLSMIEVDIKSSDNLTRLHALQKISVLCARRFELAFEQAITDRYHRPFKLARGPLPFVPTDMGSSSYISEDNLEQGQNSLPLELKKQLAEIGWSQEDSAADSRQEWLRTPMLLLPTQDYSRLETSAQDLQTFASGALFTPQGSPSSSEGTTEQQILRRNSSSGGPSYSAKRRSVFAPPLASVFLRIATLVFDPNIAVTSAARTLILDLARSEPSLLSRPLLDLLPDDDDKDIPLAMSKLNLFIHAHWAIPPPMAHFMFNHLAGFLKTAARENNRHYLVEDFSRTIPPLVDLAHYVSGMSGRELRRSKVEFCFVPTGSLWFPTPSPNEQMFPTKLLDPGNSSESVPPSLISVTLIRICQNLLFASMLRRNQQDVQFIRKHISQFELPSLNGNQKLSDLETRDFLPLEGRREKLEVNETLLSMSAMLSRSYLILVTQIFRSMSRHLSDRNELAVFIDGLILILLTHGDDIGIVSQTLITLMVASTRFRRLFMSGGAYMLFMPAVLKAYSDADGHLGIRLAIEYVIGRFYALHQDAFVFQSLDAVSRLAASSATAGEKLGMSVSDLFASLRLDTSPALDPAGIFDANRGQEREALLLNTAKEMPQALLASMRRGMSGDGKQLTFDLPEEYQAARLRFSDFIKLFFTIIAHDTSSLRAENFLRLFRLAVPYMYNASMGGRSLLQEGVGALGLILVKPPVKGKSAYPEHEGLLAAEKKGMEKKPAEAPRAGSDITAMRLDYLGLIVSFVRAGGTVTRATVRCMIDMIKGILKDSSGHNDQISCILSDFTEISLTRETPPGAKEVVAYLQDLVPIVSSYGVSLDFGRIFVALARLVTMSTYSNDIAFAKVLMLICEASLTACAGTDTLIMSLPYRSSLITLLSQTATLPGTDIASELEKHPPTYDYLAGIIHPFATTLRMETVSLTAIEQEPNQGHRVIHLWIRLLQYTLTACKSNRQSLGSEGARKSMESYRSTDSTRTISSFQIPTFVVGLQVLKVILVRAGDELSLHVPAMWNRLAGFFTTVLADGNAEFALQLPEMSLPSSPIMSPAATPRTSLQLDSSAFHSSVKAGLPPSTIFERAYRNPRIVDYAMWSLFELLCSHRTPLLLQMRLFITEKTVDLDQALRSQRHLYPPLSPIISTPGTRASAFSKPFRRTSSSPSAGISPRLPETPQSSAYLTVADGRKPGYLYQSPVISSLEPQNSRPGPRIVHLGPVSASLLRPPTLTGTGDISSITKAAKVKSTSLVRTTYRRIRLVQTYMGYHSLLPLPYHEGMDADIDEVVPSSWTKYQALEAIQNEVNELIKEFDESRNLGNEADRRTSMLHH